MSESRTQNEKEEAAFKSIYAILMLHSSFVIRFNAMTERVAMEKKAF